MSIHALIPDTQSDPGTPNDHLRWIGLYVLERRPDHMIHIGDHWNMGSLSSYDRGKKAMEGRVKREIRRQVWEERLKVQFTEEQDIARRIEEMMEEIEKGIKRSKEGAVTFNDVVKEWKREEVVGKFIPLLHLEQNQKIATKQEDFFKEIYIRVKKIPV